MAVIINSIKCIISCRLEVKSNWEPKQTSALLSSLHLILKIPENANSAAAFAVDMS